MATQIKSLAELKKFLKGREDEMTDCYIVLGGGGLRSSKGIQYVPKQKKWYVHHEIDGSEDVFTDKQMMDPKLSNIGIALKRGCLFMYE